MGLKLFLKGTWGGRSVLGCVFRVGGSFPTIDWVNSDKHSAQQILWDENMKRSKYGVSVGGRHYKNPMRKKKWCVTWTSVKRFSPREHLELNQSSVSGKKRDGDSKGPCGRERTPDGKEYTENS